MSHRVTAAAVQVTAGSRVHMVYQGGLVPAGVGQETLDRLVRKGLIEAFDPATGDDESEAAVEEFPVKAWNHDRIDEWAGQQDPPIVFVPNEDASKPLTKEQKLEQIAAELEKRK